MKYSVNCIYEDCGICSAGYKDECALPCNEQMTEKEAEAEIEILRLEI